MNRRDSVNTAREQLGKAVGYSKMMSSYYDESHDSDKGSITTAYHLRTGSLGGPLDHAEAIECPKMAHWVGHSIGAPGMAPHTGVKVPSTGR